MKSFKNVHRLTAIIRSTLCSMWPSDLRVTLGRAKTNLATIHHADLTT